MDGPKRKTSVFSPVASINCPKLLLEIEVEVNIRASSTVQPVDSILAVYVSQQNLRDLVSTAIPPFIIKDDTKTQGPKGFMEFVVMSYENYWLTVTHPEYHAVAEQLYIESDLDKIIRITSKSKEKQIDIIDR